MLAPLLLMAACGGDDDEAAPATSTTTTTTEARPTYPESVEAVPSPGCGTSTSGAVRRERRTIDVAGEERWYLLSTPSAHDGREPLPLVVQFHGLAEGAEFAASQVNLDELGEREGFFTAVPHGTGSPVKWNAKLDAPANADFAFVTALLDTLGAELCIDTARTYATGLSYGAILSSAMACAMADRFAAIAPVAGVQRPDACRPDRPVPVLSFHGTADAILLFNGGVGDLSGALSGAPPTVPEQPIDLDGEGYPAAVAGWASGNGCGAARDERHSPHVIERTYDCPPEREVGFFIVEGGGHTWPGNERYAALEAIVGPTTDELDATAELWTFFTRHANELAGAA